MKTLQQLRGRLVTVTSEAETLLRKDEDPDYVYTPEENGRMSELIAESRTLRDKVEIAESQKYLDEPAENFPPITDGLDGTPGEYGLNRSKRAASITGRSYRSMFPGVDIDSGGFENFREFSHHVMYGIIDDRLKRSLVEGNGPDGGFTVPTEYSREVFDIALESEIVRSRATIYPMKSNERKVPGTVIGDHSSSLYGGVVCSWDNEGDTLSESEPTFRNITLNANKLTALGKASNEWAEDSVGGATVEKSFGGALGWTLDRAFFNGTGVGQPLGILSADCTIDVSKEGGQAASTILYPNLTSMLSRLHPACFGRSVWIAHPTTMPSLLELSITIGAGGSAVPVMSESNGQFKILTRPVIFSEKAQTLGTKGDIMLCDFSQYVIGLRKDIRLDTSKHVAFKSDELYYRGIVRVDGQPGWDEALTLADGSTTVSPFIVIETRS
ncbi:MAG: phage major capsid protein [Candidatus Krumholzibacteria bacterium]|nr:phage major capsid protein [Candidatus Krumholzibacteria bacterium]